MLVGFIEAIVDWFEHHQWVAWVMLALSLISLLASLVFVPWAIVRMPADYFAHKRPPRMPWSKLSPAVRMTVIVAKNLLGVFLVLMGVVLSLPLVPGPGIITILVGLAMVDIPGKRWLERRIVGYPRVFKALNKLRARYGKPPLERPE